MRQLKKLYPEIFTDEDIPMCCMIYFGYVHRPYTRAEIPEYHSTMVKLTNNAGIILCPECVINHLQND